MKNSLVGKKVALVEMDGSEAMRFTLEDGSFVVFETYGDCCSGTWVEHIEGVSRLYGGTVLSVEDIEPLTSQDEHPEDSDKDVVAYYGLHIVTDKGTTAIDYRNESNGYYGGSMEEVEPESYRKYKSYSKRDIKPEWRVLDADF